MRQDASYLIRACDGALEKSQQMNEKNILPLWNFSCEVNTN